MRKASKACPRIHRLRCNRYRVASRELLPESANTVVYLAQHSFATGAFHELIDRVQNIGDKPDPVSLCWRVLAKDPDRSEPINGVLSRDVRHTEVGCDSGCCDGRAADAVVEQRPDGRVCSRRNGVAPRVAEHRKNKLGFQKRR
jgi:hypothetical protein